MLYQGGQPIGPFDLRDPAKVADLLNQFYSYTEPDIDNFDRALELFKERVPELARSLKAQIDKEYKARGKFTAAFDNFLALCQRAIGPSVSREEVVTMLIQHLLTERLIRRLFDNPDFARRNTIASEIEKVIDALTSHSFCREEYYPK